MSDDRDKLYDLCVECQRRVGSLLLALLLLSTLYWLSFFLFLDDPRRNLIGPARSFVSKIDELERDQLLWKTVYISKIGQVITLGDRYLNDLDRLPSHHPARTAQLNLDVQARISDRVLTDYIGRLGAENYVEFVRSWLQELKSLSVDRIVHTQEVLDLHKVYGTLNLPPGWLTTAQSALGLAGVPAVPAEVDTLPWQELRGRQGLLFSPQAEFEGAVQELQGLWQGEITDEMAARTLRGTGIWLRNLDSGRSIAHGFVRKEPSIRLPFLGDNISGRWAFYLGPIAFLVLMRYLRLLGEHIRSLEAELRVVPVPDVPRQMYTEHDDTLPRLARYPNLIEVLRSGALQPDGRRGGLMNKTLVAAVLLLPLSTALPIVWVNSTIAGPISRIVLLAFAVAVYVGIGYDTLRLLRAYSEERTAAPDPTPRD